MWNLWPHLQVINDTSPPLTLFHIMSLLFQSNQLSSASLLQSLKRFLVFQTVCRLIMVCLFIYLLFFFAKKTPSTIYCDQNRSVPVDHVALRILWSSLQNRATVSYSGLFTGDITDLLFIYILWTVFPIMRVFQLEKMTQNLSLTLAEVLNDINQASEGIQVNLSSLARVAIEDRIFLEFLLMDKVEFVLLQIYPSIFALTLLLKWKGQYRNLKRNTSSLLRQTLVVIGFFKAG